MLRALSLCWMSPAACCSACSAMPWARCASSSACRTASAVPRTPSARDLRPEGKASAQPGLGAPGGIASSCPWAHLARWASCSSCPA